jgi:hypothetical protein
MLDLEVIPERALACPEKNWEFILGDFTSILIFFIRQQKFFFVSNEIEFN